VFISTRYENADIFGALCPFCEIHKTNSRGDYRPLIAVLIDERTKSMYKSEPMIIRKVK
jgi:hypothetical protein